MSDNQIAHRIARYVWGSLPWMVVLLLIVLSLFLGAAISNKKKALREEKMASYKREQQAVNVVVQEVKPKEIFDRITLPANISPWEDLTILAEISGQIISISAKEGDMVKKGDILAKVDQRDFKNRLDQIQAAYDLAISDYQRISKLAAMEAASKAQLDALDANLKEKRAALADAQLAFERCIIKAPLSGFIDKRFAKEGLFLNIGDPLFQILDMHRVKVEVRVPESDVKQIEDMEEAEIEIEALGNLKTKGKKVFMSRQPDSLARAYTLKLAVENPENLLRSGMFAKVELIKARYSDALMVPLYSIITEGDRHYLYIINDDTAHYRSIKIGILDGWQAQVTEGLNPHERVVIVGQRNIEEGQRVKVIRTVSDPNEIQG